MLRRYSSQIILAVSVVIALFLFFDLENYSHVDELNSRLEQQRRQNRALEAEVADLKRVVTDLHRDKRLLEKVARDELGMARPDEMIFLFDERAKSEEGNDGGK